MIFNEKESSGSSDSNHKPACHWHTCVDTIHNLLSLLADWLCTRQRRLEPDRIPVACHRSGKWPTTCWDPDIHTASWMTGRIETSKELCRQYQKLLQALQQNWMIGRRLPTDPEEPKQLDDQGQQPGEYLRAPQNSSFCRITCQKPDWRGSAEDQSVTGSPSVDEQQDVPGALWEQTSLILVSTSLHWLHQVLASLELVR